MVSYQFKKKKKKKRKKEKDDISLPMHRYDRRKRFSAAGNHHQKSKKGPPHIPHLSKPEGERRRERKKKGISR